jgi:hypothetical protein
MQFLVDPSVNEWPMDILGKLKINLEAFIGIGVMVMRYHH